VSHPFSLLGRPLLSRSAVDRREPLVDDAERQAKLWPDARLLTVDQAGRVPVRSSGAELVFGRAGEFADAPPEDSVLLGEQDGVGFWAVRIQRETDDDPSFRWRAFQPPEDNDEEQWIDLRGVGALLGARDAGLLTTAIAVLNWRRNGGFCAKCGSPTTLVRAGWASRCTGCGREEYPRTDPAVICLVHDDVGVNGEHVLLARGPDWPEKRYSVLAGFVEAGESLEDCVAREISEEVGVDVWNVRYLGNQPWPFPRSLMIGFTAVADRNQPFRLADGEIAEAHWVSRAMVIKALDAGGSIEGLGLPGGVSIASQMVAAWARAES
jgi:NAD+ diphosphatase